MEAYLDNSATTRCADEVCALVVKTMQNDYGNPSSMHRKGVEAEQYVKTATQQIAKTLKVSEKEIYFTSGGTEADNWALIGTALANKRRGKHIITTAIEHPAISAAADFLADQGFSITRLGVDKQGQISLAELEAAITEDTILVSIMQVNNEIGSVQPIAEIGQLLQRVNPQIYFHVDAVQSYGKYRISPKKAKIDMLSVSGHKIHGPKGVGFLYIAERVKISPLILGGGQQKGKRSGTDNVSGIAGLGCAAELINRDLDATVATLYQYKQQLVEGLKQLDGAVVHGAEALELTAPHIVSVAFPGIRSEVMLHTLEERGIYVSAGSACSTHKRAASPTLLAIGAAPSQLESTVRFSFSGETTTEQIAYTLQVLAEVLPMLQRYTRR